MPWKNFAGAKTTLPAYNRRLAVQGAAVWMCSGMSWPPTVAFLVSKGRTYRGSGGYRPTAGGYQLAVVNSPPTAALLLFSLSW